MLETLDASPGQVRVVVDKVGDGDCAVAGKPMFPHSHGQGANRGEMRADMD